MKFEGVLGVLEATQLNGGQDGEFESWRRTHVVGRGYALRYCKKRLRAQILDGLEAAVVARAELSDAVAVWARTWILPRIRAARVLARLRVACPGCGVLFKQVDENHFVVHPGGECGEGWMGFS